MPLGVKPLTTEMTWPNGSRAIGITAPETDTTKLLGIRGRNRTLVIGDEAGGLTNEIVEGVKSILTAESARVLFIGNPTNPSSEFAASFKNENTVCFTVPAYDTPNLTAFGITEEHIASGAWREMITGPLPRPYLVTPEWVADAYREWGPNDPRYIARVLARFPDEASDSLFPMRHLEAALERDLTEDELDPAAKNPNELGVDVARSGADDTVIWHRHGPIANRILKIHGHDTMAVAGACVRARKDTGAAAIKVDAIGVGAGVVDRLKELREPVVEINVGMASNDPEQYLNLRSEYFWGLRKRFEDGGIVLQGECREIVKQLHAMRWKPNSRGQVVVEPKDETKKRLDGKSPDEADALMLAFAPAPLRRFVIV